ASAIAGRGASTPWWHGGALSASYLMSGEEGSGARMRVALPWTASSVGVRLRPYVGAQRLDRGTAVYDGGTVGVRAELHAGPLAILPFFEAGYGQMETLVDHGGYTTSTGYRPWVRPARTGAAAAGAGVSVRLPVAG